MTIRTGVALAALCLGGPVVGAGELTARDRADLLAVRDSAWQAWFAGDQATLKELMPADALTISAGVAEWHDLAGVLESSRAFAATGAKLTRLTFPRTEVQVYGDAAFVYSLYELDLEGPQGTRSAAGRATEIFVRQDGRWLHPGWHLDSGR